MFQHHGSNEENISIATKKSQEMIEKEKLMKSSLSLVLFLTIKLLMKMRCLWSSQKTIDR